MFDPVWPAEAFEKDGKMQLIAAAGHEPTDNTWELAIGADLS